LGGKFARKPEPKEGFTEWGRKIDDLELLRKIIIIKI
jgi:hypothetical protein